MTASIVDAAARLCVSTHELMKRIEAGEFDLVLDNGEVMVLFGPANAEATGC